MQHSQGDAVVITGAPLIGEGNIIDARACASILSQAGIPCLSIYPNGPLIRLARWFHSTMTMKTRKTIHYALTSEATRSSFKVLPLKLALRRAIKKAYTLNPRAVSFITSQHNMAEESVGCVGDASTIQMSSDMAGKFTRNSTPSERQKRIVYFVWNREAFELYANVLKLQHIYLVQPVDPLHACRRIPSESLPFQGALDNPDICLVKLSGSGGDAQLINTALLSLFKKSSVRSIVFPGIQRVRTELTARLDPSVLINTCLDADIFYNLTQGMRSHTQMLLTYPSEQVKHVAILSQKNILPNIVWLPPRGQHEVMNLAWAIQKGFSKTVCIPKEYSSHVRLAFNNLGFPDSCLELVAPEDLAAEHFKPSPVWEGERDAVPFETIIPRLSHGK